MISLGDLLVFLAAVAITLAYIFVLHRFISQSEKPDNPDGLPGNKPPEKKSSDHRDHR